MSLLKIAVEKLRPSQRSSSLPFVFGIQMQNSLGLINNIIITTMLIWWSWCHDINWILITTIGPCCTVYHQVLKRFEHTLAVFCGVVYHHQSLQVSSSGPQLNKRKSNDVKRKQVWMLTWNGNKLSVVPLSLVTLWWDLKWICLIHSGLGMELSASLLRLTRRFVSSRVKVRSKKSKTELTASV